MEGYQGSLSRKNRAEKEQSIVNKSTSETEQGINHNNRSRSRTLSLNERRRSTKEREERDMYKNQSQRNTNSRSINRKENHFDTKDIEREKEREREREFERKRDRDREREAIYRKQNKKRDSSSSSRYRDRDRRNRNKSRSRDRYISNVSRRRDHSDSSKRSRHSLIKLDKKDIDFQKLRRANRDRSKSNSALRVMKMKNIDNGIGVFQRVYDRPHEDNDPKKAPLYWDGYQFIKNQVGNGNSQTYDILKPGKTVQISNIPLNLNIDVNDFKDFITKQMLEKNVISSSELKELDDKLIRGLELDYDKNSGIITLDSIDIAKRMILLDGIKLLGSTLRFSPYMETKYEESTFKGNLALANSADLSAKSAAVAYAALNNISSKSALEIKNMQNSSTALVSTKTGGELSLFGSFKNVSLNTSDKVQVVSHEVLKVMNIADKGILKLNTDEYNEMKLDVKNEFEKYGKIINFYIVSRKSYQRIGAELGAIFIEYSESRYAEQAYNAMKGKKYEDKLLKMAFLSKEAFYNDIYAKNIDK